ncbi:uncharacterized protein LY89DRAFT_779513 [Mollisia scopiformis]|uniref:Clr5 domain-containing protein n=1 Tax=Mollisia scopiformis TaxID=149040 RepID=A0A194XKR1_MOLSC|nr:uncharacterized protein LY89DRAFT_779513 [Mollisia scopiformis]KUJ20815.1 hypothetical protein LY89DRAFT_779513 [Mollisia scopiformis]
MDGIAGPSVDQLNAPYAERWGLLKEVMVRLFLEEGKKYKEIVKIMEIEYKFYATENQYKRQFGAWNVKKALPTKKKIKISKEMETRAQQGKASMLLYNDKMENQKIRRYMKKQGRRDISIWTSGAVDIENLTGHALQTGNRVFMNWNLPSAVLRFLNSKAKDHISPNPSVGTPMSGVLVATPSSNSGPSPRNPSSPSDALSPDQERSAMTATVKESLKVTRAHLFVQKHHKDLFRGMNLQEQCVVTDYFNQFWQHSFVTAKNWGHGPRTWDASTLKFNQFSQRNIDSLPGTPAMNTDTLRHSHHQSPKQHHSLGDHVPSPSDLCRWSIHVLEMEYDPIHSPEPAEEQVVPDPDNKDTWRSWQNPGSIQDFAETLEKSLEGNKFSTIEVKELPISIGQIIRAAKRSPEQLLEEAFGFSIMARNIDLVSQMGEHLHDNRDLSFHDLYPLHLAASYLDGTKTCCLIFHELVHSMVTGEASVRKLYTNHLNHTVLDNLMLTILKAHTFCPPVMVDDAFKKEHRFAGEEVDICGRWDADSDCIRHLQASGSPTIPRSWKHMFCHTSAQTITHCVGTLFYPHWKPDINTPSGLFLKRCPNETCGMKLQLKPLHTLVVTAVYLAQFGTDGENLFGIVASLLSLLRFGANPLLKADISPIALLGSDTGLECTHSELDPFELAQRVPQELISQWPQGRVVGWKIFCHVLRLSQNDWDPPAVPGPAADTLRDDLRDIYAFVEDEDDEVIMRSFDDREVNSETQNTDVTDDLDDGEEFPLYCPEHEIDSYFGKNKTLITLWAAVQTELLTYRRLAAGDPWVSANFDMLSVLKSLETGAELSIKLVSKQMMKPACFCGTFAEQNHSVCLQEEACAHYFSNLEDWSRSSFIEIPE